MFFEIGAIVRVREDLESGREYYMENNIDSDAATDSMAELAGHCVEISDYEDGKYLIVEDAGDCYWTDEMFAEYSDFNESRKNASFAAGDHVECIRNNPQGSGEISVGDTGVVVVYNQTFSLPLGIMWDKNIFSGHDLGGRIHNPACRRKGWWVTEKDVVLCGTMEPLVPADEEELVSLLI